MAVETARRRVRTAALPGARMSAAETETSAGAGLARARGEGAARVWGAVAQAAEPIERIGQQAYRQLQIDARNQANEVALLEARNKLSTARNRLLYDPDAGALNKRGKDAMATPGAVGEELEKIHGEIAGGLHNDEQRIAFERMYADERNTIDLTLNRHISSEMNEYRARELASTVKNAADSAVVASSDPIEVARQLQIGTEAIETNAPRLGLPPETVAEQVKAFKSEVHVGVIRNLAASGQDQKAQAYFEAKKKNGEIAGDAIDDLENMLDTATTNGEGLRASREIWGALGPKSDKAAINFDQMEEEVARRYGDDPKKYAATMAFLRERKASVDAGRKERDEAISGGLYAKASGGATLDEIQQSAEFLEADGKTQAAITDYIVRKKESEANRRYAEEGRAFTARQRGEAERERKGWGKYWDLSDPKVLANTSENQLHAMRGELGDEHVNRLLTQKRQIGKGEQVVRDATIDDDMFKSIAHSRGLSAFDPSDEEKIQLGQLKAAVEAQIDAEQSGTGKVLERARKEAITKAILDQRVNLTTWGGLSSTERVAATVVTPEDRSRAFVPMERIPEDTIRQYLNYARSAIPAAQRMDDAQIRSRFSDRIQRAYALRLIGATRTEIEAAMKGQ